MKLTGETKFFIGIIVGSIVLVIGGIVAFSRPETVLSRSELIADDTQIKGNASASAYLVEFSDFQCPACAAAFPLVSSLVARYGDQLAFAYRHFPLDQHEFAEDAAYAAEAAGEQGKFWDMHDLLFENQDDFSEEKVFEFVEELELNEEQFKKDYESDVLKEKVNRDRSLGTRVGVNSTPTFFLNGKKLNLTTLAGLETELKTVLGE